MNTVVGHRIPVGGKHLSGAALAFFLILSARLLISLKLPLHPDEAYYWMWSRYLDLSYYDQGPGIAFAIRFFTSLFGNTQLALKVAAALTSTLASVLLVPAGLRMGLTFRNALMAAVGYSFLPGIWGGSLLILHDSLLLLFWNFALVLALMTLDRLRSGSSITIPLLSLALITGLGALAKHTMVLFVAGLVLWWALSGRYGFLFKKPAFYGALAIGALVLSPLLVWNLQHDFAGVDAIRFLRSSGAGMDRSPSTGKLILGQILAISPVPVLLLLLGAAGGIRQLIRPGPADPARLPPTAGDLSSRWARLREVILRWREIPDPVSFSAILTLLVFGFFFVLSFRSTVQGNWLFPAYGTAALLVMAGIQKKPGRQWAAAGLFFLTSAPLVALSSGVLPPSIARSLPYAVSLDRRLGGNREAVEAIRRFRDERAPGVSLLATRYQDAAIASFYLPGQPYISSLNILMQNQYSYWHLPEKNADYIVFLIEEGGCASGPDYLEPALTKLFRSVEEARSGKVQLGSGEKYWKAYVARGFKGFPDGDLAEIVRSKLILYFMPTLRTKATDPKTLSRTSETLLHVVTQERARREDCHE